MKARFRLLLRFLSSLGFLKLQPELVLVTIALLSVSWWLSLPSSMWISLSFLYFSYPVHVFILRHLKSVVEVGRVQSLKWHHSYYHRGHMDLALVFVSCFCLKFFVPLIHSFCLDAVEIET